MRMMSISTSCAASPAHEKPKGPPDLRLDGVHAGAKRRGLRPYVMRRNAHDDEEEGHRAPDGLGGRAGGHRKGIRPLVQRGASGRAPLDIRLSEWSPIRSGERGPQASRLL